MLYSPCDECGEVGPLTESGGPAPCRCSRSAVRWPIETPDHGVRIDVFDALAYSGRTTYGLRAVDIDSGETIAIRTGFASAADACAKAIEWATPPE